VFGFGGEAAIGRVQQVILDLLETRTRDAREACELLVAESAEAFCQIPWRGAHGVGHLVAEPTIGLDLRVCKNHAVDLDLQLSSKLPRP
jgi:hypothetical protein